MTFVVREIAATITLGVGQFGATQGSSVTLTGLRMSASIGNAGVDSMAQAQMKIFGLPLALMNQLTVIGTINQQIGSKNTLLIAAGDKDGPMSTMFTGTIQSAWAEMAAAPDVVFNVAAFQALDHAVIPVGASSFKGAVDVATIMAGFAKDMGYAFENNGVSVMLSNPYFPGTKLAQVREAARAARIRYTIDCGTLAIWPLEGSRGALGIPVISPSAGMVGYPTYTSNGLNLSTIFMPDAKFGGQVQVQSSLTPANGTWVITNVQHELESRTPGGQWFTHLSVGRVGPDAS